MDQIKFTKQSLIDWQVTRNGIAAGWISKIGGGMYKVTTKGDPVAFVAVSLREAKAMATRLVLV